MSTSRKRKSGLQSGLSEIVARQTAPVAHKQATSASLLNKFREQQQPESTRPSPDSQTAPVTQSPPVPETRPVSQSISARSESAPVSETAPVPQTAPTGELSAFAETLSYGKGHTRLNHDLFDHVLTRLDAYEQLLFIHLLRYRKRDSNSTVILSLPRLATRMRVSEKTAQRAIRVLESKGLVVREGYRFTGGGEQGGTYRLVLPTGLVSETAPVSLTGAVSETPIKETHIKEHTQTQASVGVGVGSRFTLAECRSFAEHLRSSGQGITNPGGYATRIHRTGEADDLVAAFLAPAEAAPKLDVTLCPDCRGTGFYEPGGAGKGVARCKHERLGSPA